MAEEPTTGYTDFVQPLDQLFCIEIFAGSGRLTACLKAIGLSDSFGVDTHLPKRLICPVLQLDLLKPEHLQYIEELISLPNCAYVHLAPPCGTSSRARLIQRRGRWNPPILRTEAFPNGLPGLSGINLTRVTSANRLYGITCNIIRLCEKLGKLWSCENPGRSFMWLTDPFQLLIKDLNPLEVMFHHCQYGSGRRKLTKFLHHIHRYSELARVCDNSHEHEPWGQVADGRWATSLETAYPWDLCRTMTSKLALELQDKGAACAPPCFALQEASLQTMRAATDIQPRKGLPAMVTEFLYMDEHPSDQPLPPLSRALSTPHPGVKAASDVNPKNLSKFITIGVHRSPEQFIDAALEVGHPTRVHSLFPDEMHKVIDYAVSRSHATIAQERTAEMRRWTMLANDLRDSEASLLEDASSRRKEVLKGKRLALLDKLLYDANHGDLNLVRDIVHGFDLTGPLPEAHVFRKNVRPASIPCAELRKIAATCRKALLKSVTSSGDAELDKGLMEATHKELAKGFIVGPINEADLPEESTLTRRFAVRQKNKIRPIDDYRASMVNASVTQTEGVSVHTVDHISAMIALWLRANEIKGTGRHLMAKCWDLSDAYKQLPLSDHAFQHDAYLVVYDPDVRGPVIFQQNLLPFGSIASVTSFLRLSLAIWKLGTELLHLMWSSYFDDFLSLTERGLEKHSEMIITFLFSMLGWKLSSEKLIAFDTVCKVLGVQVDLGDSHLGAASMQNTPERSHELVSELDAVVAAGCLTRKEAERLRGRLQFASGQIFGRTLRNLLRNITHHLQSGRKMLSDETMSAVKRIKQILEENVPRKICGRLAEHVHIYVDASYEPNGYSGIGGTVLSSDGVCLGFFSEEVCGSLLEEIMAEGQKTAIQELECFAALVALIVFKTYVTSCKTVLFTDSESVRGSFLKSWSQNLNSDKVLRAIFKLEDETQSQVWVERVPSQSNPADVLSRETVETFRGAHRTTCDLPAMWRDLVLGRGDGATKDV